MIVEDNRLAEIDFRHLNFDVEALQVGAIVAKAYGASECNEIEVIGEGHLINPFQGHSTVYFVLVSTLAMMLLLIFRFVMLVRRVFLHAGRNDGLCPISYLWSGSGSAGLGRVLR